MISFMTTTTTDFEAAMLRQGKSPKSCAQTARIIDRIADDVDTATPDMVALWLTRREPELSPASIRAYCAAAKSFFRWRDNSAGSLETFRVPPLPAPVPHPLPAGVDGVRRMIAGSTGQVRTIIALQGLAGLRVAEARAFDPSMIDAERGELVVRGKGRKIRRVPISTELAGILEDAVSGTMSDRGARAAVTRIAERVGVAGHDGTVSSHDLRATFATAVYAKTGDILLVSRLLGHASVTQTQTYLGLGDAERREAVEL